MTLEALRLLWKAFTLSLRLIWMTFKIGICILDGLEAIVKKYEK